MGEPRIPVLDVTAEIESLWEELTDRLQAVLRSGQFILGPEVSTFEAETADYLRCRHAVAVNSGTDALVIALRALGIDQGDEVITSPFTFFATAEAISTIGATPVFVDIDPATFNLDPALVEEKVTPRTKALLPVHLYGQGCDMGALVEIAERYHLVVLEDVAQAFGGEWDGQKLGTIGRAGAFSFFPSKNLGAVGDGGLVATNDDEVARLSRMLRTHGGSRKYHNEMLGYNSRLDEIQAAVLRVKLPRVDKSNDDRRRVAARYRDLLADVPGLVLPSERDEARHVFHQYTVRIPGGRRDAVRAALDRAGIGTMIYYPVPLHRLPVYANLPVTALSQAENAAAEVLSLPIWPGMPDRVQEPVAAAVREVLSETKG